MNEQELLRDFMKKFRLNCHYRFMFMPPEIQEIPFHIYKAAYLEGKDEMKKGTDLSYREEELIDNLYDYFIQKVKETDNYNEADEMVVKEILQGYDTKEI